MENKKGDYFNYIVGGVLGAVVGIIAAYLVEKSTEFDPESQGSNRKNLSRVGFRTIGMLWSLIDLGKGHHG